MGLGNIRKSASNMATLNWEVKISKLPASRQLPPGPRDLRTASSSCRRRPPSLPPRFPAGNRQALAKQQRKRAPPAGLAKNAVGRSTLETEVSLPTPGRLSNPLPPPSRLFFSGLPAEISGGNLRNFRRNVGREASIWWNVVWGAKRTAAIPTKEPPSPKR